MGVNTATTAFPDNHGSRSTLKEPHSQSGSADTNDSSCTFLTLFYPGVGLTRNHAKSRTEVYVTSPFQ